MPTCLLEHPQHSALELATGILPGRQRNQDSNAEQGLSSSMSHAHLLFRRLVGGALGVLLPTVCAHAQIFDTVSTILSVQFSGDTIETSERLIFANTSKIPRLVDPGYREHQPRMKFAGLKDKDLEKELSEAAERENEISEALDRCFASAKEDLRLLSLEHETAEKLSRELTIAQQEISSLKTLLAEARGVASDASASKSSEALQAMNTTEPAATNDKAVQPRSDKSEGAAHAPALPQEEPSPSADASVSPSRHSGPDIVDSKSIPEMEKTKSELAMGDAVGNQQRRDEPDLDTTAPRQNELQSSAERFVTAVVESWSGPAKQALTFLATSYADRVDYYGSAKARSLLLEEKQKFAARWPERNYTVRPNTLRSSCEPGSSLCMVEGVVDWISRSEKRGTQSSGTASFSYQVKATDRGFEILGETGSTLSRHIESIKGNAPKSNAPKSNALKSNAPKSNAPKSNATEAIGALQEPVGRQEVTVSRSPPVPASDRNLEKAAVIPSLPSLAQRRAGQEEAVVPPSLPRLHRNKPIKSSQWQGPACQASRSANSTGKT